MVRADIKSILRAGQSQLKKAHCSIPKEAPQAERRKIIYRMKNDPKFRRSMDKELQYIKQAKKEVDIITKLVIFGSIITIVYYLGKIIWSR